MAGVVGVSTVAGGLTATDVADRQGSRQQIVGNGKAAEKVKFALAEASGLGASGITAHLMVMIPLERQKYKQMFGMRK